VVVAKTKLRIRTCGGVGRPDGVHDGHGEVEGEDGRDDLGVPDLDGPVGGGGDEGPGVEVVPAHLVDGEQVALVGLLVLAGVGLGALVDTALLSAQDEDVGVELVEVEAEAGGQTDQRGLVLVVAADEFQPDDLFGLELVLHQVPVHDAAVGGDGVEVVLLGDVGVPVDLPHGVRVLLRAHVGLVDGPLVLVADVVDQHASLGSYVPS